MCWAACDRLASAAETLGLDDRAAFWNERADTMRKAIEERAWRPRRTMLSATFGGDDIDASLLQLLDLRFLEPEDPRFLGTLAAVEANLRRGSHMLRYAVEDDFGMPHTAFNVCTFWLIEALHFTGRDADARALFEEMLDAPHPGGPVVGGYRPGDRRVLGQLSANLFAGRNDQLRRAAEQTWSAVR